eukprot:6889707-Karenia_brevis.AAC.1
MDESGAISLGLWTLDPTGSSAHSLLWRCQDQQIVWKRVKSPPTAARPWQIGKSINFLYASEASGFKFVRRTMTVAGYKSFAQGQALFARTSNNDLRTFYLHKMFDVYEQ